MAVPEIMSYLTDSTLLQIIMKYEPLPPCTDSDNFVSRQE